MTLHYADTSAIARAYFVDETDHDKLRTLLVEGTDPVVTSELTRIEFTSMVWAAYRGGRMASPRDIVARFDKDCGADGPFTLISLVPTTALPKARNLIEDHSIRTLDALHLAVALTHVHDLAAGDPITFVTRDRQQAQAAKACGLTVA